MAIEQRPFLFDFGPTATVPQGIQFYPLTAFAVDPGGWRQYVYTFEDGVAPYNTLVPAEIVDSWAGLYVRFAVRAHNTFNFPVVAPLTFQIAAVQPGDQALGVAGTPPSRFIDVSDGRPRRGLLYPGMGIALHIPVAVANGRGQFEVALEPIDTQEGMGTTTSDIFSTWEADLEVI